MPHPELLERARSSAYRIMRSADGKRPLASELAQFAAAVIARHWLKAGSVTIKDNSLSVIVDARTTAKWVAKRLEWMANPDRHHGQQAGEYADNTIRALRNGSISADQLFARCDEFGRLRRKHIDRNTAKKPRTEARSLKLSRLNIVARWLISEAQIDEIGHSMENCLANKDFAKEYKSRLRQGNIELVVLEGEGGRHEALLSIDAHEGSAEQVKGPGNSRPIHCREAIIAVLAYREALVGECTDLLELGICDHLLKGREGGATERFTIGQRECEVGDGFLTVVWGDNTILLRSNGSLSWDSEVCVISSDNGDYLAQASTRVWLRSACRKHPEFARVCATAFRKAPRVFRLDWFGASPHRAAE